MNSLQRRGKLGYEDLMQELEVFEHELLKENGDLAMTMMVLETKIRERFQLMENRIWNSYPEFTDDIPATTDLANVDVQAMIPQDLPFLPTIRKELRTPAGRRKTLQTVGMAAILAVLTAIGVFGLASILQLTLSWIA